ncbi:MAG: hypothetical protein QXL94_00155 [Candidatus Parvarchaeum sp.]
MEKEEFIKQFGERAKVDYSIVSVNNSKVYIYADTYEFSYGEEYVFLKIGKQHVATAKLSDISLPE